MHYCAFCNRSPSFQIGVDGQFQLGFVHLFISSYQLYLLKNRPEGFHVSCYYTVFAFIVNL
jgi:ABC-type uncharacterized transport system permease subunit